MRAKHPRERTQDNDYDYAKEFLFDALWNFSREKHFSLGRASNFWTVFLGSARALSSSYPVFLELVKYKIRYWHKDLHEATVAVLMAGAMSHFSDRQSEVEKILLELLGKVSKLEVKDLASYRLKHHLFQVLTEVTGDEKYAYRAVDLAHKNPALQIEHLYRYGWLYGVIGGSPKDVGLYYSTAAAAQSTQRGKNNAFYNQAMKENIDYFIDKGYFQSLNW